eukprot:CAMPEP_0194140026 /NCGR_PEP_ID=MMETSP0152-20130528/9625_1 /TAXON_ID=1049557 /ORGANISM="Thalassiothrix antarctica, Strain L6-D1" /LENGTH=57 /DNA_ID=CAMNT_0038838103 /DNA_START=752 /DNA_END=925 /DNA_ORIENTATION=+
MAGFRVYNVTSEEEVGSYQTLKDMPNHIGLPYGAWNLYAQLGKILVSDTNEGLQKFL